MPDNSDLKQFTIELYTCNGISAKETITVKQQKDWINSGKTISELIDFLKDPSFMPTFE